MDKETIKTYNYIAEAYEYETTHFWELFPRTFIDKFKSSVNNQGIVLDLGSGPGRDGQILTQAGLKVVCLDASPVMSGIAHQKGLPTVTADFLELPFTDHSVAAVWSYTSLLHLPKADVKKALQEINRILKPGGLLGLGLIEGDSEGYSFTDGNKLARYFAYYSKGETARMLFCQGFESIYFEEFKPKTRNYLNFLFRKIS